MFEHLQKLHPADEDDDESLKFGGPFEDMQAMMAKQGIKEPVLSSGRPSEDMQAMMAKQGIKESVLSSIFPLRPASGIPHKKGSEHYQRTRDYFAQDAARTRQKSKERQSQSKRNESTFEMPQIDTEQTKNLFLFEYAKGLVKDFVDGMKNGILQSTAELKPPASQHAHDLAKCLDHCLQSCLTARSNGAMEVSFKTLYEKLLKTEFDNTLQAKIQALFVSHIPSMPYNYWTEVLMADKSEFGKMLDRIVEKGWNEDAYGSIGAKHYFQEGNGMIPGYKTNVLPEEDLEHLKKVQNGTEVYVLLGKFYDATFKPDDMKVEAALTILKDDCNKIEECVKAKSTDTLEEIKMPAARAVAYRLIKGKDPTPEMQRAWYKHSLQKYVKPPQDSKKLKHELYTQIQRMRRIEDVAAAAVKFAQSAGVLSGDKKEREFIHDVLAKWARKQATPDTAGAVKEGVLTRYEQALSRAQAKAQPTNPSSSLKPSPDHDALATPRRTAAQPFLQRPMDPADYAPAQVDLSSSALSDKSVRSGASVVMVEEDPDSEIERDIRRLCNLVVEKTLAVKRTTGEPNALTNLQRAIQDSDLLSEIQAFVTFYRMKYSNNGMRDLIKNGRALPAAVGDIAPDAIESYRMNIANEMMTLFTRALAASED